MKKTLIYTALFLLSVAVLGVLFEIIAIQAEKEAAGQAEYIQNYLCKIEKNCD